MHRSRWFHLLPAILSLLAPAAPAQLYVGTDLGTVPYTSPPSPINLTLFDESSQSIPIGFTFTFYGSARTNVVVHANGFLTFSSCSGSSCWSPAVIPTPTAPNYYIAPCWLDFNPGGTGVRYQTEGSPGSRTLTVEWDDVPEYGAPSIRHTAKVVLFEADSSIEFHWGPSTGSAGSWTSGIEDSTGSSGQPAVGPGFSAGGFGPGTWPTDRACRIQLSLDPDLTITRITPTQTTPPTGGTVDVDVEVWNNGAGAVASCRVDLFVNPPAPPPAVGTLTCPSCDWFGTLTGVSVPAGPAGSVVVTFTGLSSAAPGGWDLYAVVDTDGSVTEFNELNNVTGPVGIFWAGILPMPFFDDFEGGMNLVMDPVSPQGGGFACGNCATTPCRRCRGTIRSGYQSNHGVGGTSCLVLDAEHRGGINEWPATTPSGDVDDPTTEWDLNIPEHQGTAQLNLDTTGYSQLTLEFDYNFIVNSWWHTQFTVEVDDGSGWQYAPGPTMGSVPGAGHANSYVPDECLLCGASCPGCAGFYNDQEWVHETIDLSTFTPGPAFSIRFRFVCRHNYDGSLCATAPNAILIDNLLVDGITQGLIFDSPWPPGTLPVDSNVMGVTALPFSVTSIQQTTEYDGFTFTASGTGDDAVDILDIHLYEDTDGSQDLSAPDVLLDSVGAGFPGDDGAVAFVLASPVTLAPTSVMEYLIVLDLAGSASAQEDFRVDLTDVNILTPVGSAFAGIPAEGVTLVINDGDLTLGLGPQSPVSPVSGVNSETNAEVAQLEFVATGSAVSVDQISMEASGTGDDSTGILQVQLAVEDPATTNGQLDPAEPILVAGAYAVDDGQIILVPNPPVTVSVNQPTHVLVLHDYSATAATAASSETYCFTIDDPADLRSDAVTVTILGGSFTQCAEVFDACPSTICGDCSGDGSVSILDALVAAQHAAALTTLTGSLFSNCNVTGAVEPNPGAEVTILDALLIAQIAAGLTPVYGCC